MRAAWLPLLLLVGCGPTWSEAFDGAAHGALSGVWGSGPDDVWIVGGQTDQAEILHYDGSAWSNAEAPDVDLLAWVYGWSATEAMAVGVHGAAAWWDGTSWEALDTPTDEDLWGVFGFSPDDVWIVGGDSDTTEPVILHYDGDTFTDVGLAEAENPRGARSLFKVWGIDDTLFAVGANGTIASWDGAAWRNVPAGAEATQDFVSLWGPSADDIVAVGGRGNARVSHWDGSAWDTVAPGSFGGLNAVSYGDDAVAVVGGIQGFVGTFDPATGELTTEELLPGGDVHAIWSDGDGAYYAVGGVFSSPMTGMAWVRR